MDIVKPCLNSDFGGGFDEIAEGDHVGVCRGVGPIEVAQLVGQSRLRGGIHAGADEFEDAAEGEVVAHDLGEEGGVRFRGVGAGAEIGDGDAGFGGIA